MSGIIHIRSNGFRQGIILRCVSSFYSRFLLHIYCPPTQMNIAKSVYAFDLHPKAVPGKVEISDVLECFFMYSSGVMLSSAEWGLN